MSQIRRTFSRIRTYLRRLAIWASVARQITGISPDDRRVLRRSILRAPIDALKDIDQWRDPHVVKDCEVQSSLGRFHIRAASDDLYIILPSREPGVLQAICDLLRPGDCFVDAGANIGAYTVLAARLVGPTGKILAVEMMPDTARILRRHIVENECPNVDVVERALSDRTGQFVEASVTPGKFGSASIVVPRDGDEIQVQTATLADVIAATPCVRLIKMDLEGAEYSAVQGLAVVIDRIENVLFEDWGDGAVSRWFDSHGFDVVRLDANNALATSRSIRGL